VGELGIVTPLGVVPETYSEMRLNEVEEQGEILTSAVVVGELIYGTPRPTDSRGSTAADSAAPLLADPLKKAPN